MSDINGLVCGTDGKLSLRRIAAAALILGGAVLMFIKALTVDVTLITTTMQIAALLGPGAALILFGCFLIGLFTWQNIAELVNKKQS